MGVTSILTQRRNGWKAAIAASRSDWVKRQPPETAVTVRRFMRGCGIAMPLEGGYTAGVARFVHMFQDCLILDGPGFDYNGRDRLTADHFAGPLTLKAMERSANAGFSAWEHLRWQEIAVKDDKGKQPTYLNPVIHTERKVVQFYAAIRTHIGEPLPVASWFRSVRWNTIVGGATLSQHLLGLAIDWTPHPKLTEDVVRAIMFRITGHNGGGVGVVERWTRRAGVWVRRVSIVGPAHADLRATWSRWPYRVAA